MKKLRLASLILLLLVLLGCTLSTITVEFEGTVENIQIYLEDDPNLPERYMKKKGDVSVSFGSEGGCYLFRDPDYTFVVGHSYRIKATRTGGGCSLATYELLEATEVE
ncbi:hypothetical protein LCGC14_0998620 [marine sediment metagenome]|uniref:Uncharacterized protein n=1 Tax=marine sediment metagenome TaxID=412755 RepID=A0A0F9QM57_9ZZZZ